MAASLELAGTRFGKLVCIAKIHLARRVDWVCRCDCGGEKVARSDSLKMGRTWHCGCQSPEKYGLSDHPLSRAIIDIKQRCLNPNNKHFKSYGGRGITVCEGWANNHAAFVEWGLQNGWQKGLQIDRIDNDSGYRPDNCRFVTSKVNHRNMRKTIMVDYKGRRVALKDLADEFNMPHRALFHRIQKCKMSVEEAISLQRDRCATKRYLSSRSC